MGHQKGLYILKIQGQGTLETGDRDKAIRGESWKLESRVYTRDLTGGFDLPDR